MVRGRCVTSALPAIADKLIDHSGSAAFDAPIVARDIGLSAAVAMKANRLMSANGTKANLAGKYGLSSDSPEVKELRAKRCSGISGRS